MRSSDRVVVAAAMAVVLWGALAAGCAGARGAGGAAAVAPQAGPAHLKVDTGLQTCAGCHAEVTPRVAAEWRDSRHGLDLVECVVCHGSTGSDFRARPQPSGCGGCHAIQVASVSRGGAAQDCFGCHPAHALRAQGASPHRSTQEARP